MKAGRANQWLAGAVLACAAVPAFSNESAPGLLFYLSANRGTTADVAAPGTDAPTYDEQTGVIADGARGPAIRCEDLQKLAWRAPGNIYAQRGTLSFYWRSRYPVGPTAFPVFRVAYGDHSSWDMAWLRIDYNGHGFDAFVTDASLARTRVSVDLKQFPSPRTWTLVTFTWDETRGVSLYLNGKLAASKPARARFDAALDQFGPHSRIISPHQVQSDYNFTRGGDIDEIRIYDRALPPAVVARLARDEAPALPVAARPPAREEWQAWLHRHGWEKAAPPYYPGATLAVRKAEIHDAYDLKRWWWKATDGIRETTWPGVYNRSRLPGRNDYFQLPDWDTYVEGGKSITFTLPDEPVNQVEISGAAWGKLERLDENGGAVALATRAQGRERTVHALSRPVTGGRLRFTNTVQEAPIGELAAYHVAPGAEPQGSRKLAFRLGGGAADGPGVAELAGFIQGRFPATERATLVARPADGPAAPAPAAQAGTASGLPVVQVLIPDTWDALAATDGLDGIAIDLPALPLHATKNSLVPFNVQVKDPLWPMRDMLDVSLSVKPGQARTLWLDLRDRILPAGKGFWLSIAAASPEFDAAMLAGAQVRLVFKPRAQARAEHEPDRFTQARDSYAMLVEEHPKSPKLALWVRFERDLLDLLRVNPDHPLGRAYAEAAGVPAEPYQLPPLAAPPAGVPLWAWRQAQLLGRVTRFANYYIDQRQSAYGDFGGGISDDTDLLNLWPGIALMGSEPDKIGRSNHALLEAAFRNGMFTNGLSTIQTDELHSYEEGINALGQVLVLEHGSPRQLERAMDTARGVFGITGVNGAGHRHIRTAYYSGSKMALEAPWNVARGFSYLVMQPGQMLVDYNGSPSARRYMTELADGLLAHWKPGTGPRTGTAIRFDDDADVPAPRHFLPWHVYWGAYRWSGDARYLAPLAEAQPGELKVMSPNLIDTLKLRGDGLRRLQAQPNLAPDNRAVLAHMAWQQSGDKSTLAQLYTDQIAAADKLDFINTEGSLWIDRVETPSAELQRARLGGLALLRYGSYPAHVISWRFAAPATAQSVAILVPNATATGFKVIAYNLETAPVTASMTGWNIDPGVWEVTQGIDRDDDDVADGEVARREVPFERSRSLAVTLAPRSSTVLAFKLKKPGTPYSSRQDLGLDREDVALDGRTLTVKVHSLGGIASKPARVRLVSPDGTDLASAPVPPIAAPDDLRPKTAAVTLQVPAGTRLAGMRVVIDTDAEEITALNDTVQL